VGQGAARREVELVAFTGLGFTPEFVWATPGDRPEFFGVVVPGYLAALPEGYQDEEARLTDLQKEAEAALLGTMTARLAKPMPGLSVIRNAKVFDAENARLHDGLRDVYIQRGRIIAITRSDAPLEGFTPTRQVDAAGRVLLPGLYDMHGHVGRWGGGLNLAAGVTTSRDVGNDNATLQQMIDETADGRLFGPQIVAAGFLEGESPYSARSGFVVSTLEEAKRAVDWYAAHGYIQIKVYNSFPRQHLRETVAHAHSRGLRVSGHVPAFMRAAEVVEAGFDEVNHINQVMLNFLVDDKTDTRTLHQAPAGTRHGHRPDADHLRFPAPARWSALGGLQGDHAEHAGGLPTLAHERRHGHPERPRAGALRQVLLAHDRVRRASASRGHPAGGGHR
jgi:hypothetical protein